jgi:hypothetical protein
MHRLPTLDVLKENLASGLAAQPSSSGSLEAWLELQTAGSPDPLALYISYIHTTHNHALLEHTLNKFRQDSRYLNDMRYIELWILRGDSLPNPIGMYIQILQEGIGTQCALLYVSLARLYEYTRKFDDAEGIYILGIYRQASPFYKLRQAYLDFILRKPTDISNDISFEELRALPYLRAEALNEQEAYSPIKCQTPAHSRGEIPRSAFKVTPKVENLYHSPNVENSAIHFTPQPIRGRLPLQELS